ncbi:MAG: type I-C CRISPR-associated protein Cas8c/Csd1, partial [candidate division WOR-3 bacterium]
MLELLAARAFDAEPGFAEKQLRWALVFDRHGVFLDVVELGDVGRKGNKGQMFPHCPEFDRPYMQSGGKSEFLWGAASIVALHAADPSDEKLRLRHRHFVELLHKAAEAMPELGAVAQSLDDDNVLAKVRGRLDELKVKSTDKVTLRVGDVFPLESEQWHDWWRQTYRAASVSGRGTTVGKKTQGRRKMVCFATGKVTAPLETHPKIEGLAGVGGLATGDVLVGMDKDAFGSYFLEQSANAAVAPDAAFRYRAALNELIRTSSRKLAGALVVHWFKNKVEVADDPLAWLEDPPEVVESSARKAANDLLESIAAGKRPDLGANRYYALTLSGMSGRVMVRDWLEGQFAELVQNIGLWFDDLSIVSRDGDGLARDPRFTAVLGATVRELGDLAPPFVAKMWRVAVRAEPIPQAALAMALGRFKADIVGKDKTFNHARLGLMKAYHVRKARI